MLRRKSRMRPLDEISGSFDYTNLDPTTIPKVLYGRKSSLESLADTELFNESKVLVLYTGGTIGMTNNDRGKLAPSAGALESCIRLYPHMHDAAYSSKRFPGDPTPPLVLPSCREKNRIFYWVFEYNPLLDSCDMTMDDWIRVVMDIKNEYDNFDGFVVLHGTDTLAYTASALSFMTENLGKPIIITGSQIPLFETRSDGRDNFIGSVIIAGNYSIPEVAVFFNNKLYRGNRTVKVSSGSLDAFSSPNLSPLAVAGISIQVDYRILFRPMTLAAFSVNDSLSRHIGLLRLFPSISAVTVKTLLQPPTEGAVLQTYGAGNFPTNRQDIIDILKEATGRGVIIVNITQCSQGSVQPIYETGQILKDAGVLPGYDMTPEAALTKLSYVVGLTGGLESKLKLMMQNLRGELTLGHEDEHDLGSGKNITALTRALQLSDSAEVEQVKEILIPSMFYTAIANSDLTKMDELWPHVKEINHAYAGGLTALHVAAAEGDADVVEWLLCKGASVHVRDNNGHTSLWCAVEKDHMKVINMLKKTGAHLKEPPLFLGEMIVSAAGMNNVTRLRSLEAARCDMNLQDIFGRTGLHAACSMGHSEAVQFLLACGVHTDVKDKDDMTPAEYAEVKNYDFLVEVIDQYKKLRDHFPQFQVRVSGPEQSYSVEAV